MPTIADWLMVVITAIYVVATIIISCANIKSANATREQLIESKRQYEDKKRLEIMPYIQFEETRENANHVLYLALDSGENLAGIYILLMNMKNIGNGTAKNIEYTYQWDNGAKVSDCGPFPVQALSSDEKQTIRVEFAYNANDDRKEKEVYFLLRYKDLLENAYTQNLELKFVKKNISSLKIVGFITSAPILMQKENINV